MRSFIKHLYLHLIAVTTKEQHRPSVAMVSHVTYINSNFSVFPFFPVLLFLATFVLLQSEQLMVSTELIRSYQNQTCIGILHVFFAA